MSSARDRLAGLAGVLTRSPWLRHVGWSDALRYATSWYGLRRRAILNGFRVTPIESGFLWVETGPYALAWPSEASLSGLATALVEVWALGNSHYYFDRASPLSRDGAVADVGACEGGFALECLLRRGVQRVYAFEPNPRMAAALRATAERNHLTDRLVVVEAAVGAVPGLMSLILDTSNPLVARLGSDSAGSNAAVPVIALDEWRQEGPERRLTFLKIDAEGADVDVLHGARQLLRSDRPAIAVTAYHALPHANEMVAFLEGLDAGYRIRVKGVVTDRGGPRPVMLHAAAG